MSIKALFLWAISVSSPYLPVGTFHQGGKGRVVRNQQLEGLVRLTMNVLIKNGGIHLISG
jgi:hypothetical protein